MGHYTQAFGLHMVLAPVDGVGRCGCGLWREHPRVRQSAGMSLEGPVDALGRCVLEDLEHDLEVAADSGHGQVVRARRRLADCQRPLILFSRTLQPRLAAGTDAPEPTAGHPLGHLAGQPSKMDTLAWPAGRRQRTPRRTATAADRMAGHGRSPAVRWSQTITTVRWSRDQT